MILKYIGIRCNNLSNAKDLLLSQFNFNLISECATSCKLMKGSDYFILNESTHNVCSINNVAFSTDNLKQFHTSMIQHNFRASSIKSDCQNYPGIPYIDVASPMANLYHRIYESNGSDYCLNSSLDHILFGCHQLTAKSIAIWYSKLLNLKQYHFKGCESGSMKVIVNGTGMEMFANYADHLPVFAFSEPIIEDNKHGKNQIDEFLKTNNGGGIQHLAFKTDDIVETITNLKNKGVRIIQQPHSYYRLDEKQRAFDILGLDLMTAYENSIIVDQDDDGYLLQVFTESLFDKHGVFIEIIERRGCRGFGAGNVKALFSALQNDKKSYKMMD